MMIIQPYKKLTIKTYDKKHRLFAKYIKEIQEMQMSPFRTSAKDAYKMCEKYITSDFSKWRNIFNQIIFFIYFVIYFFRIIYIIYITI